jgi:GNAT superfamily N-acetyltransferase
MEEISICEEAIDYRTFNSLRKQVGWEEHEKLDIELALRNTLFLIVAKNSKNEIIGMARIIGDRGLYYYIQDVIVIPEYQGRGIGRGLMAKVMEYIKGNKKKGLFIGLMAAKGKEGFYKKWGFIERPAEEYGPGMCMEMD